MLGGLFNPLLNLGPFWAVFILSLVLSLIIILIYKYATNQKEMKRLKDEIKEMQKKLKEHRGDPKKLMEINKLMMDKNMKYTMHSMRATLITFIPVIIIFGWLNSHLGYVPLYPGNEFGMSLIFKNSAGNVTIDPPQGINVVDNVTKNIYNDKVEWRLNGTSGEYLILFHYNNGTFNKTYQKKIIITSDYEYEKPLDKVRDSHLGSIIVDQKPLIVMRLGRFKIGWLGTYIIFSLIFSLVLRKIFKVY